MFWMRSDQAPLQKHGIEDTPRDHHVTHLTYSAFAFSWSLFPTKAKYARLRTRRGTFWDSAAPFVDRPLEARSVKVCGLEPASGLSSVSRPCPGQRETFATPPMLMRIIIPLCGRKVNTPLKHPPLRAQIPPTSPAEHMRRPGRAGQPGRAPSACPNPCRGVTV